MQVRKYRILRNARFDQAKRVATHSRTGSTTRSDVA